MILKKILCLVLCTVFAAGLFSGCGKKDNSGGETDEQRLIFTVNGHDIYEDDFRYIANQYKSELETYYGTVSDWNAELESGVSYGDYVMSMAENWFKYAEAIKSQAIRIGVELTGEDMKALDDQWQSACEANGGEEAYLAAMAENGLTKELNDYISQVSFLADKCFTEMYGYNGEKVSDEDCAEKTADDGYIMAKHILILTAREDEDGNTVEFSEDEKADARTRAENLLSILDSCAPEDLEEKFDEIMQNNSEDDGLSDYPNGYLFQEGNMVTEFYEAAAGLQIGEYSGVVESEFGYHIIMRIPVDYDVIPMAYAGYSAYGYDYYTLRYLVANSMFSANIDSWIKRVEVTDTEVLESLDMESVIAVG